GGPAHLEDGVARALAGAVGLAAAPVLDGVAEDQHGQEDAEPEREGEQRVEQQVDLRRQRRSLDRVQRYAVHRRFLSSRSPMPARPRTTVATAATRSTPITGSV